MQLFVVHADYRRLQDLDNNESILFVDASNTFNSLNRDVTLRNVRSVCPVLAPILINTYRSSADLYANGQTLSSQEGTTQGDPLSMPMYAIGTKLLICHLEGLASHQLWYADDSAAGVNLLNLKRWWDRFVKLVCSMVIFQTVQKLIY